VVLVRSTVTLPLRASLAAVFAGSAGNALISHLGEVPRIMMAARATGVGAGGLLASIVAERVFDLCAISVLLALLLLGADEPRGASAHLEWILGTAGLVAFVMVVTVLHLGERLASRLEARLPAGLPRWRATAASRLRQVLRAFQVFRKGSELALAFLLSLLMWALFAACILGCLLATGTNASFGNSLTVLGVNAAALILPAPPGRVGTIEASFVVALAGTSMDEAQVLAASIVYNMLMTIPFWCIGGFIWWRHSSPADVADRSTSRSRKPR
jgi:glycosyltransferase 2 family protein